MLEKKNADTLRSKKQIIMEIWRLFWNWMIPAESSGYATDVSLAEFCMEMFDGGKWQRQLYFNFVFGIEAQFLAW